MGAQRGRIETLDAIRGVCAIAVMLMHSEYLTGVKLAPSAYLAVDMFFLMSGFVLGAAYDERLRRGGFLFAFLERRVARLWPMWAIGMTLGAIMPFLFAHRSGYGDWALTYALGMLLLPMVTRDYLFPYNTPGWSLFFEALANIGYAASARHLGRRSIHAIVVAAGLGVTAAAFAQGDLLGGYQASTLYVGLARVCFSFFLGLAFYRAPRPAAFAGPAPFLVALAALTAAFFVAPSAGLRPLYDCAIVLVACPAMLLIALKTELAHSWLAETLGALSYPLYAIHFAAMLLAMAVRGLIFGWGGNLMSIPAAIAFLAGLIVVSDWLGRRVDPMTQRFFGRVSRQPAVRLPLPAGDRQGRRSPEPDLAARLDSDRRIP